MSKGMEIAEKYILHSESESWVDPKVTKLECAAAIDAAIAEAVKLQAVADCKAVCELCAKVGLQSVGTGYGGHYLHEYRGRQGCNATDIRAAWLREHGTELEANDV